MEKKKNYIYGVIVIVVVIVFGVILFIKETPKGEAEKCLITLFGKEYDVTMFRKLHQGGDVFVCGSDMTADFQRQHGNDTARIERELGL